MLLKIDQRALGPSPSGDGSQRQHGQIERLFVVDDQERPERVILVVGFEDLVLRVDRIPDAIRSDRDRLAVVLDLEVPRADVGSDVGLSRPIDHGQRDVEVFRRDDVRQLARVAVRVRVAGPPAARVHIDPTLQRQRLLDRLATNFDDRFEWQILVPAFDRHGVATGEQFKSERMRRDGCVHLNRIRIRAVLPLVPHRRTGRDVGRLREEPFFLFILHIDPSGDRLRVRGIDDLQFDERLGPSLLAALNDRERIGGRCLIGIDVLRQITQRDDLEAAVFEILHELFKACGTGADPVMLAVRHAMKLEHGNATVPRLSDRSFEVFDRPIRSRISRRRDQQRMIDSGLVGESATPFVGELRSPAASGELNAELLEDRE